MMIRFAVTTALVWLAGGLISCVSARAILGIDLGSLYMKVALVQRGAPLEIVTNLHSKRKTEQMILFDAGTRFYGADANSLLARKPTKTPAAMSVMLGRDDEHPAVKVLTERHYPLTPSYNETRHGLYLTVDGKENYTPEELVAMVLLHAKDMTLAYGEAQGHQYGAIQDCVLTVPSFATQHERLALLDAAKLAEFNVLGLIDENTATALHFGMDKTFEEPQVILFYNLGASSLQVSLVKFHSYDVPESKYSKKTKKVGSIEVLGKAWDSTLGGQAFDNRLVEFLADKFNQQWRKARNHDKEIRDIPRAMTKIRLQATKVKQVLSANKEIPIYMDALYDDMALSTQMTREKFEELCEDLLERAIAPVHEVVKAANLTMSDVNVVELIGGGMRIPRVQSELQSALGELELGMHINSDESMALGASFFGANISTAFRVRQVGLTDINPFPISISLENLPEDEKKGFFGGNKKKSGEGDEWSKKATMFKANGKVGVKKTIAFTHDKDVHCSIDYEEVDNFPEGTQTNLQRYSVKGVAEFAKEMEEKGLGVPKVSLQFELSQSGITELIKAEAAVEETYTVEEEEEVDDDDAADDGEEEEEEAKTKEEGSDDKETAADESNNETEAEAKSDDKKKKKKKKKTIMVEKEKKRTHKKSLDVSKYYVGKIQPYSAEIMEESKSKMDELARKDKERIMLEEARNRVESYIYMIKNKLVDYEEAVGKVSTEEQREALRKSAEDAEEWLYDDGYGADLETMEAKYKELSEPAEKVWFRMAEVTARPEAISTLKSKLDKIVGLMTKWETAMPQVTEEERAEIIAKIDEIKKWIEEKEEEQAAKEPHEDPAFTSEEVPLQTKPLERLITKLSKKPKPKPEKKKNETESEDKESDASSSKTDEAKEGDGKSEESKEEDASTTTNDAKGEEKDSEESSSEPGKDEEL